MSRPPPRVDLGCVQRAYLCFVESLVHSMEATSKASRAQHRRHALRHLARAGAYMDLLREDGLMTQPATDRMVFAHIDRLLAAEIEEYARLYAAKHPKRTKRPKPTKL